MHRTWPEKYTQWQSALLPAEEFLRVKQGTDAGWPYYYYDQMQGKKLLNPEYGGDGKKEGNGSKYEQPLIGFPGHFAPNDILFYTGDQFPEHYKNGAFIAFHGSTIRAPYSQAGYFVAFVPFKDGNPPGHGKFLQMVLPAWIPLSIQQMQCTGQWVLHKALMVLCTSAIHVKEKYGASCIRVIKQNLGSRTCCHGKKKNTSAHIKDPDEVADNLQKGAIQAVNRFILLIVVPAIR